MKAKLTSKAVAAGLAMTLACAMISVADTVSPDQQASASEKTEALKTFEGTIASLNGKEHTVTVDGFWTTKTFNPAATCEVRLEDQPATLADLRPGQKVKVAYEKRDGVLISRQISQRNMIYEGRIASYDPEKRTMEVSDTWKSREFSIPADCPVMLHDNQTGTIEDLQMGQRVKVIFESPPDTPSFQAHRIVQDYESFSGTIRAIDADTKTVKAKTLLNEKKFNLARDCKVILADQSEGTLRDLQIGDRVEFSYEDADGVLVANLITQETGAEPSATVQASAPRR